MTTEGLCNVRMSVFVLSYLRHLEENDIIFDECGSDGYSPAEVCKFLVDALQGHCGF